MPSNHELKAPHFPEVAAVRNSATVIEKVSNTASKNEAQRTATATIQPMLANVPQVSKGKLETSPKLKGSVTTSPVKSMKNQKVKRTGGNGKE